MREKGIHIIFTAPRIKHYDSDRHRHAHYMRYIKHPRHIYTAQFSGAV